MPIPVYNTNIRTMHPVLFNNVPHILVYDFLFRLLSITGEEVAQFSQCPEIGKFPSKCLIETTDINLLCNKNLESSLLPCYLDNTQIFFECSENSIKILDMNRNKVINAELSLCNFNNSVTKIRIEKRIYRIESEFVKILVQFEKSMQQNDTIECMENATKKVSTGNFGIHIPQLKQIQPRQLLESDVELILGVKTFYELTLGGKEKRMNLSFLMAREELYYSKGFFNHRIYRFEGSGKIRYFRIAGQQLLSIIINRLEVYQTDGMLHELFKGVNAIKSLRLCEYY